MTYKDRQEAGRLLAFHLQNNLKKDERGSLVIVGLPRGGIEVAREVARRLKSPLDFIIVKKIGHPDNPEYAVGAVTASEIFLNPQTLMSPQYIKAEAQRLRAAIAASKNRYRAVLPPVDLKDKVVVIVDDGIATGLTVRAAAAEIKAQKPSKIYIAVPVASTQALKELSSAASRVICLYSPLFFGAVGEFYRKFNQLTEEDVVKLMA